MLTGAATERGSAQRQRVERLAIAQQEALWLCQDDSMLVPATHRPVA